MPVQPFGPPVLSDTVNDLFLDVAVNSLHSTLIFFVLLTFSTVFPSIPFTAFLTTLFSAKLCLAFSHTVLPRLPDEENVLLLKEEEPTYRTNIT